MEKHIRTRAIVIRSSDFRDADRLMLMFSEEAGMISVFASSSRKPQSKLSGHCSVPSIVNCQLVRGKQWFHLVGAQCGEIFDALLEREIGLLSYQSLLHIIEALIVGQKQDQELFQSLGAACRFVNRKIREKKFFEAIFFINVFGFRVLQHLGLKPRLDSCVRCSKKIVPMNMSQSRAGPTCFDCGKNISDVFPLSPFMKRFIDISFGLEDGNGSMRAKASDLIDCARLCSLFLEKASDRQSRLVDLTSAMVQSCDGLRV